MIKRNILGSITCILIFIPFFINCEDPKVVRQKAVYLNPDCNNCTSDQINVIYIRANSSSDVLHYVYAGGEITKTLSVFIIRSSDINSNVSINWDCFMSNNNTLNTTCIKRNGVGFSSIFGLVFTKLYLYQNIKNVDIKNEWGFDEFKWNVIKDAKDSISFVSNGFSNNSSSYDLFNNNSEINIKFTYSEKDMDNKDMPRLHYNSNNTLFNFVLKNMNVPGTTNAKFTVQLALINSGDKGKMAIDNKSSFDDEVSPGVFRILNFLGQTNSVDLFNQTYLQWKPVCYTKMSDTTINSIAVANPSDVIALNDSYDSEKTRSTIRLSIVYMGTGEHILEPASTTSLVNVTFGSTDEKGYKNYLTWYGSFGYGRPPYTSVSVTVIMVIIFGLGLPFILVVVGSIYLVVKKRLNRDRSNSYTTIDEQIN